MDIIRAREVGCNARDAGLTDLACIVIQWRTQGVLQFSFGLSIFSIT